MDSVRGQFPALARGAAFFDGPGGTQVPRVVVDAMSDYLFHHNANTHWAYPTSVETDAMLAAARADVADFLGCAPAEVVFGANMTTLTLHVSRALGRQFAPGDELIVTELDHHANVDPWRQLARDLSLVVHTVAMDPATGLLDYAGLGALVGPRTRLVAVGAASNALGTVNDIARIREMTRGALLFVDAVHYAPHFPVDVSAWGCDFLACSAYKFYGPHVGILYVRSSVLDRLDPHKLEPCEHPLETGTLNHEGIVGTGAAVRFMRGLSHSEGLLLRLWDGLAGLPGVRLYGPPPGVPRTPTVAFTVEGSSAEEVARRLGSRGVYVSHGDFYATTVVRKLGVPALLRAGCACYTSEDDVDRLVAAL